MKFGIIIPVHNSERTLKETLLSVVNQTRKFDEVVIVNNNSSDMSEKIIIDFLQEYDYIKYEKTAITGVSNARNIGIEKSTTEWLGFLDADDVLEPTMLMEVATLVAQNQNINMLHFNFLHYYATSSSVNPFILNEGIYESVDFLIKSIKSFDEEMKNMIWSYFYQRSFLLDNSIYFNKDITVFEDILFLHELFLTGHAKILVTHKVLIKYMYYNFSATQLTSTIYLKHMNLLKEFYIKLRIGEDEKQYLNSLAVKVLSIQDFNLFYEKNGGTAFYIHKKIIFGYKKIMRKMRKLLK